MEQVTFAVDFPYVRPEGGEVVFRAGSSFLLDEVTIAAARAAGAIADEPVDADKSRAKAKG